MQPPYGLVAGGKITGASGAKIGNSVGITTFARTAAGLYTFTLTDPIDDNDSLVVCTPNAYVADGTTFVVTRSSDTVVNVNAKTSHTGADVDVNFSMALFRISSP